MAATAANGGIGKIAALPHVDNFCYFRGGTSENLQPFFYTCEVENLFYLCAIILKTQRHGSSHNGKTRNSCINLRQS